MSEVAFHIDEANQMVIAERDGQAVGVMPWSLDGKKVILGLTVVAAHERRKGVGSGLATTGRERFPREEGWQLMTTPALSPLMLDHLWREGKDARREGWFDFTGTQEAGAFTTPQVNEVLSEAQRNLDTLLGK